MKEFSRDGKLTVEIILSIMQEENRTSESS